MFFVCLIFLLYLDRIVVFLFIRKLKEINGLFGFSVVMECKVYGLFLIFVFWFYEGNEISSGRKY